MTQPRIPLLDVDSNFSPEQQRVVDALVGRRGGRIPGPFRFALHCPEIAEAMHPLGETLRLKTTFPLRLSELAIIVTARAWDCDYVFQAHAKIAIENGLAAGVAERSPKVSGLRSRRTTRKQSTITAASYSKTTR